MKHSKEITFKEFEKIYDKVIENLMGNLTNKEYRELLTLEYVLTWGYNSAEDEKRYLELGKKKYI